MRRERKEYYCYGWHHLLPKNTGCLFYFKIANMYRVARTQKKTGKSRLFYSVLLGPGKTGFFTRFFTHLFRNSEKLTFFTQFFRNSEKTGVFCRVRGTPIFPDLTLKHKKVFLPQKLTVADAIKRIRCISRLSADKAKAIDATTFAAF
jgi:hypothetical protein